MSVSLVRFDPNDPADCDALVNFMVDNYFPYHVHAQPTREQVESVSPPGDMTTTTTAPTGSEKMEGAHRPRYL